MALQTLCDKCQEPTNADEAVWVEKFGRVMCHSCVNDLIENLIDEISFRGGSEEQINWLAGIEE